QAGHGDGGGSSDAESREVVPLHRHLVGPAANDSQVIRDSGQAASAHGDRLRPGKQVGRIERDLIGPGDRVGLVDGPAEGARAAVVEVRRDQELGRDGPVLQRFQARPEDPRGKPAVVYGALSCPSLRPGCEEWNETLMMVLFRLPSVMFEAVRLTLLPAVAGSGLAVNEPTSGSDGR